MTAPKELCDFLSDVLSHHSNTPHHHSLTHHTNMATHTTPRQHATAIYTTRAQQHTTGWHHSAAALAWRLGIQFNGGKLQLIYSSSGTGFC